MSARRLLLDTAPVIYFVEDHRTYAEMLKPVFDRLDARTLVAVTTPVTLAECLIHPLRGGDSELVRRFTELLTAGPGTEFASLESEIGAMAAALRERYDLTLLDAFQCAAALHHECDLVLTNDLMLKRVREISVLTLDELNASTPR